MRRSINVVLSLTALLFLTACGTEEGFVEPISVPTGFVRVFHALPDSTVLSVSVSNLNQASVNFSEASPFFNILPGLSRNMEVFYFPDGQRELLLNRQLTVPTRNEATVIIAGTVSSPVVLELQNPPITSTAADYTEVQIVHAANSLSSEVGFLLVQDGDFSAQTSVLLGQFSESLTINPSSGDNYELLAVSSLPATGTAPTDGQILWRSGSFSLPVQSRALLVLADYFGPAGKGVRVASLSPSGTQFFSLENLPAAIRIINTLPDQGPIDVFLNDVLFAANVTFNEITDGLLTDLRGQFALKLTAAGDPSTILAEATPTISQGNYYTLTVTGLSTDTAPSLALKAEDKRNIPTRFILTATHASPSSGLLDYYFVAPATSITDESPKSINNSLLGASSISFDPGSYDLIVTDAGTKDIVFGPLAVELVNGEIYNFHLTDAAGGGLPLQIVLEDGFN
ncbi:MAG: DUF4397 domain-containing protein [SAR86 cluster bacterium]|jgi:hypothetical protein|uniref:DUF4397 domain-containing protein n=1 Tax=SAR86 cluster bacterium TaxID=2030880 RepID=A0A972W121_9GAMM|nr:DUF4397 domain-containing protein [SAR86 cluster bacterium]